MLHTEDVMSGKFIYECRHDNNGNAIHVIIDKRENESTHNVATVYKHAYMMWAAMEGLDKTGIEMFKCHVSELTWLYDLPVYSYDEIKKRYAKKKKHTRR